MPGQLGHILRVKTEHLAGAELHAAKAGDKPAAPAPTATLRHPLDPLSEAEIHTALTTVLTSFQTSRDLPKQSLTFPLMALADPAKAFVLAWKPGQPTPRIAEVQILHNPSNRVWLAEVDVPSRRILKLSLQPRSTGKGAQFQL